MSFANYDLEAQTDDLLKRGLLLAKPKDAGPSNLDTIIQNTSHQIETYGLLVASFNNEKRLLGSRRDGRPLRDKLSATQQNIMSLGSAVRKLIADVNSVMSSSGSTDNDVIVSNRQHMMKDRLISEFDELEKSFEQSARSYAEKAASIPLQVSTGTANFNESSPLLSISTNNRDSNQEHIQVQETEQKIDETELQYHVLLTEERNRQIEQVAEGIREVNSIFKDLGELVNQQGEQLDTVEENVLQMSGNAHDASRELTKAHEYQKRRSKWRCILLVALCVAALIVVLAVIS
ncbi:t-SNARE [Metschnikowia bicuspidata var. bicuspidata NRRL YB-4993]|uniref:t-SNARE n=1 Tax=Metschnikowia bicuspidata var. bicuspidata NRRL YB-4993 TaxID=869754 RepID=A0A1A0HA14_9ASCO|nr:t-SNARE [Metschnikowia bicuspidata var. bicuspidata NRRL YB-4993]OBA20856.1 t-SNARE [Metschnikowia bicuspidata var. bicuspidata NRRL YB-4993]